MAGIVHCGPGLDVNPLGCAAPPTWAHSFEFGLLGAKLTVYNVQADCSGNLYVTGTTDTGLPGAHKVNQAGSGTDYYVIKISPAQQILWIAEDGPANNSAGVIPYALTVDSSGNVYIAGAIYGGIDTISPKASGGFSDYFVSMYNSSGARVWTGLDGPGGSTTAIATGVAVDPSGNVYVDGQTTASIASQTYYAGGGQKDLFIARYTPAGTLSKTIEHGAPGISLTTQPLAMDSSGNVYAAGTTSGALDGQSLTGGAVNGAFISQFGSDLTFNWTRIECAASSTVSAVTSLVIDAPRGVLYVGGNTQGAFPKNSHLDGTGPDAFMLQLDLSGNFKWAVQAGPATGNPTAKTWAVGVDPNGNPYLLGSTTAAMPGKTFINAGGTDNFLAAYDASGNPRWVAEDGLAGATGFGVPFSLGFDSAGNVYVGGCASGTAGAVGMDGSTQIGTQDAFVTQYDSGGGRH